jgi:hypothetical protein
MSNSNDENIPLPQGPWGFPGLPGGSTGGHSQAPSARKKMQSRRREQQAKVSRKINRHK